MDSHRPGLLTPKCELMVERQAEVAQQIRFVLNLSGVKPPHVSFQIVLPGGAKGILFSHNILVHHDVTL